jgi:hypothetical protein
MMWRPLLAFFMVCGLLSCSRSGRIPADILNQEKMAALLFDISMSEGHIENAYFRDSAKSRDSMLKVELDRVLLIHGVTQADFLRSYQFYRSRPHLYKIMVDSLQAQNQRDQSQMYLQPGQRRNKKKTGVVRDTIK